MMVSSSFTSFSFLMGSPPSTTVGLKRKSCRSRSGDTFSPLPNSFGNVGHCPQLSCPRQQKNQVLLLIEEVDPSTYECQVGEDRGRVHKSHMKIITPLSAAADLLPPQVFVPVFSCRCPSHTSAPWRSVCSDLFFRPFSTQITGSLFRLCMISVQVRRMTTKQDYELMICNTATFRS